VEGTVGSNDLSFNISYLDAFNIIFMDEPNDSVGRDVGLVLST
jgi:hypothetical protein